MSELKAINTHGVRKDDGAYYDRKQADEYIDELDERHTTEITALEVSYRLQLDGLRYDKDAEIRRLKRALWLARAERYKMKEFIAREEGNLRDQMAWSQYLRERTYNQWVGQLLRIANLANKLQNKCRAKAEEYK